MMSNSNECNGDTACPIGRLTPDRAQVGVWRQLNTAHEHIRRRLSEAVEHENLSLVEFSILDILEEQDQNHLRMQDVAVFAGLSNSATTRLVNRLEERKLLVRVLCDSDRRGIYTELTGVGKDLLGRVRPQHDAALKRTLNDLDVQQALTFVATNAGSHA